LDLDSLSISFLEELDFIAARTANPVPTAVQPTPNIELSTVPIPIPVLVAAAAAAPTTAVAVNILSPPHSNKKTCMYNTYKIFIFLVLCVKVF
jgi:hypothetical protein